LIQDEIGSNIDRFLDPVYAEKMIVAIDDVRTKGDLVGWVFTCILRNIARGLGALVFDKVEADLENNLMSLPATKGFEIGSRIARNVA
jgi:chorismate synthase